MDEKPESITHPDILQAARLLSFTLKSAWVIFGLFLIWLIASNIAKLAKSI